MVDAPPVEIERTVLNVGEQLQIRDASRYSRTPHRVGSDSGDSRAKKLSPRQGHHFILGLRLRSISKLAFLMSRILKLLTIVLLFFCFVSAVQAATEIAITVDDLPGHKQDHVMQ